MSIIFFIFVTNVVEGTIIGSGSSIFSLEVWPLRAKFLYIL